MNKQYEIEEVTRLLDRVEPTLKADSEDMAIVKLCRTWLIGAIELDEDSLVNALGQVRERLTSLEFFLRPTDPAPESGVRTTLI